MLLLYHSKIVILPNGVTITWIAKRRRFFVKVPEVLEGQMCGLCGDFNANPDDDLIIGPQNCGNRKGMVMGKTVGISIPYFIKPLHTPLYVSFMSKIKAKTRFQFGVSWLYLRDTDFGCRDECEHIDDPEPECPLTDQQAAKDHCADLYDVTGPFGVC